MDFLIKAALNLTEGDLVDMVHLQPNYYYYYYFCKINNKKKFLKPISNVVTFPQVSAPF